MNPLLHWLTSPEWALVVKTLLHTLWEGALIAAVLALLFRRIASPTTRYRLALAGLAGVMMATLITWAVLNASKASPEAIAPMPTVETPASVPDGPVDKVVVLMDRTPTPTPTQWTAWLALVWLMGASVMLGRASVKVAGAEQLRRACQPLDDPRINTLLGEARRALNLTRQVRVAVTQQLTSPAVVGVLVPTLILPLSLLTTLSHEQIRFVLLHELAHIRRGDYLANLFQLFAEALLFFNPAVWWISHQIRREREACCDALAIELSGAPADYARTLVSVAESMLNPPPTAAPAFGGERESSSLADRIQRLLVPGYRPSLRLTWRAVLSALVLGGLGLTSLAVGTRETVAATAALVSPEAKADVATNNPTAAPAAAGSVVHTNAFRMQIENKLLSIRLERVEFDHLALTEVIRFLAAESRRLDPDKKGINFILNPETSPKGVTVDPATGLPSRHGFGSTVNPATGLLIESGAAADPSAGATNILKAATVHLTPALTNVSLREVLEATVKAASCPLKFQVLDYGIMISENKNEAPLFYSRTFKVDVNALDKLLGLEDSVTDTNDAAKARAVQAKILKFLSKAGVNIEPPKTVYFNDHQGALFVRSTLQDLDTVEEIVKFLNVSPLQVNIRAQFVEVPSEQVTELFGPFPANTPPTGAFTGILTHAQFQTVLHVLERREGVDIISAPDVTTVNGRQAQVQMVDIRTIVTGLTSTVDSNGMTTNTFQTAPLPMGPILDVIPTVSVDGYTVQMTIIPTVTEFLGYDEPGQFLAGVAKEKSITGVIPLPRYRERKATTSAVVWDGQTIMIGGFVSENVTRNPDGTEIRKPDTESEKKQLFVFVTPTIIDPAGNRVHSEADMPFARDQIPPQTPGR